MTTRLLLLLPLAATAADLPVPEKPAYNRDVRPILADTCFRCHGFDKNTREADRRLDTRDGALAENDGVHAIVPGKPDESELVKRLLTSDPDDVMPPPKEARQLTAVEKEILRRWIAQGAEYEDHWAYIPPVKPAAPGAGHPIDSLISARLTAIGLTPAPPADPATLARRMHLDLTGLPPTPADVEAFVNDKAPDAAGRLADKLIASPQFGERMAVWWLDQTRYADTIGYHSDNPMPVSPWRDYVIRSLNADKPFDRFTIEHLAGDLLPEKTQDQLVASGYNRLILSTEEGGAQPKQYEAKYLVDRVKSVGTTWLGQTYMCAECHDHKYDPVTARDFYSLGAFFADVDEVQVGKRGEGMLVFSEEAKAEHAKVTARIKEIEQQLQAPNPELDAAQAEWEKLAAAAAPAEWKPVVFEKREAQNGAELEPAADGALLAKGKNGNGNYLLTTGSLRGPLAGFRIEALPHKSLPAKGPGRAGNGNFVLTEVVAKVQRASGAVETLAIGSATADMEQASHGEGSPYKKWPAQAVIDQDAMGKSWGWAILPEFGKPHQLTLALQQPATLGDGDSLTVELWQNHEDGTHSLGHFRILTTGDPAAARLSLPAELAAILQQPADKRNPGQRAKLAEHFRKSASTLEPLRQELAAAAVRRTELEARAERSLVTTATPNLRTVRVLPRGDWQNETGEVVLPATPEYLPEAISSTPEQRRTRLDLARWLVSPKNPLTARVQMNRLWKLFYGTGIVRTLEDMGTQSEVPHHQPLLDWLACEFMERGWSLKHMVRLMVTSRTYALSSSVPPEVLARDPQNREFARGGRWRLDAEFVRDNALAVSGLLVRRIGGPSVKPYQPAGYWENLNFPVREWDNSKDDNQWRRGLYTWWQRSYVQPSLLAFDAPTREECSPDRTRSNIPQQALALLNDLTYVEAARVFAARILKEGGSDDAARLKWAWQQATQRAPSAAEVTTLAELLGKHRAAFHLRPADAAAALKQGQARPAEGVASDELAAWMSVARVILNLHETITRS